MRDRRNTRLPGAVQWGAIAFLTLLVGLASSPLVRVWVDSRRRLDSLPRTTVWRTDLNLTTTARGIVQCSTQVEIRCQLEKLDATGAGRASNRGSASTILSLVPEGTIVKQGDVLCELDSSEYQALVEQQEIRVAQARAVQRQAQLDLEIAELSAREFEQGLLHEMEKSYEGQIALARSDFQRATDHLAWSTQMVQKGYSSPAQITSEKFTLMRAVLILARLETVFRNFQRFSVAKQVRILQSQIEGAKATYTFGTMRYQHEEERLAFYQSMVERCTIRAPHEGIVIYANETGKTPQIFLEAQVRQRQRMFYLPDLSELQVLVFLHESVVSRIATGMRARMRVEALPGQPLEGTVANVSPLPLFDSNSQTGNEVKYYLCQIQLDTIPRGLRPGMTTEVEIRYAQRSHALVIPVDAMRNEGGRDVCYVMHHDHLERRAVQAAQATPRLLEVIAGLQEGESVALGPL